MSGKRSDESASVGPDSVPLDVIALHSSNLLTVLDSDGVIQYESPAVERIYRLSRRMPRGLTPWMKPTTRRPNH